MSNVDRRQISRWVGVTMDPTYEIKSVAEPPALPATPTRAVNPPDDARYDRLVDLCRRVVAAHDADDGGPTVAGSLLAELQRELVSQ